MLWCCGGVVFIFNILATLRSLKKRSRRNYQDGYLNVSQEASRDCVSETKLPRLQTLWLQNESLCTRAPQGQSGHEV